MVPGGRGRMCEIQPNYLLTRNARGFTQCSLESVALQRKVSANFTLQRSGPRTGTATRTSHLLRFYEPLTRSGTHKASAPCSLPLLPLACYGCTSFARVSLTFTRHHSLYSSCRGHEAPALSGLLCETLAPRLHTELLTGLRHDLCYVAADAELLLEKVDHLDEGGRR